jgi:hypothetical protein
MSEETRSPGCVALAEAPANQPKSIQPLGRLAMR